MTTGSTTRFALPTFFASSLMAAQIFLISCVTEFDGVNHRLFRNFLRAGFDHHDAVHGADDHQVQLARALLVVGRVDHELAVHLPDAHRANGTVERNVRDGQRNRSAVDAEDIRIVRRCRPKAPWR